MSEDLEGAADRLYGGEPADFVAERARLTRAARAAGDRDLAARIGALEKPSAAAALVNDLARHHADDLGRLIELGAALREAQAGGDRAALSRLTAQRRRVLSEIVDGLADRAAESGRRPGPGVLEEVRQTLVAALGSDEAEAAARSGRLVRALDPDGFGDGAAPESATAAPAPDREAE
ncbi:hypothetical protein ACFSBI_13210, partial [Amnibacterium endophyticum]